MAGLIIKVTCTRHDSAQKIKRIWYLFLQSLLSKIEVYCGIISQGHVTQQCPSLL